MRLCIHDMQSCERWALRLWNPGLFPCRNPFGQDKTVYVYRILVEDTLEERIDTLLTSKRAMASSIMGAASANTQSWTREELLELLKPID